jgi:putative tryptophan/tyrosine transport system substrate-binding protein
MRRREFVFALGLATLGMPLPARAQESKLKRVGVVFQGGPHYAGLAGLREGLKAAGLEEGAQFALIPRDGQGNVRAVEAAASDFERNGVDIIVAFSTSVTLAAKRATLNVPIVFAAGSDPVAFGLVDSIAKPSGRVTGVHSIIADLTAKRFEFLRDIVPTLRRIVTFYDPGNPVARSAIEIARAAAQAFGLDLIERQVTSPDEDRKHLRTLKAGDAEAYFFVNDAMVLSLDKLIVDTANSLRMVTMAYELDLVIKGALAGYGLSYRELGYITAKYVSRIFAGARPSDLPVESIRPTLAINLKTAKALGLTIPPSLLARADEVIE